MLFDSEHKRIVEEKVAALIKRAETEGWNPKRYKSTKPSSLHEIIKTPEQAKRFMKMLDLVQRGEL